MLKLKTVLSIVFLSALFAQVHFLLTQLLGYGKFVLYNPNHKLDSSLWFTKTIILVLVIVLVKTLRERLDYYKPNSVLASAFAGILGFSLVVSLVQSVILGQEYSTTVSDVTMTRSALIAHVFVSLMVSWLGILFSSDSTETETEE